MGSVSLHASDFYDKFPGVDHSPGDIWNGLSTYGVLTSDTVRGVVVTPACDLSNDKVETVTFLPMISVLEYFSSAAVLPMVYKRISGLCQSLGIQQAPWMSQSFEMPLTSEIESLERAIDNSKQAGTEKLRIGCTILRGIVSERLVPIIGKEASLFFGEQRWQELMEKVVKNSFSSDVHFLPKDGLPTSYSAVPEHSLVLYRFPTTVPLQLLNRAIETPESSWRSQAKELINRFPAARSLAESRPIKLATLSSRFYSDLITRYLALHIRIGAPSFDSVVVNDFASQLS